MALVALLFLVQTSTVAASAIPAGVRLEAFSTPSFTVEQPRLDLHGQMVHIEGIVCRRPLHLGSSPDNVRIERIGVDGTVRATQLAAVPPLSRRLDQRCGRFGVPLHPPPVSGELIRLCIARTGTCAAH